MWIVKLQKNINGSHNSQKANHITTVKDGWAMIPDDFSVPDTFPFVDIETEEVTYYRDMTRTRKVTKTREVDSFSPVTKTREVEDFDDDGNPIIKTEEYVDFEPCTVMEEYEEEENYTEQVPYTMMTVTKMTPGIVPELGETVPEPTQLDRIEAQVFYTAMLTETLLEGQ